MFDAVVAVGASVTFVLGSVAMLNVAMTTKTKHMQAWSVMYVFAILAAVSAAFTTWVGPDSLLHIVPNVAAVGTVGGLWSGCRTFNGQRPRLIVLAVFLATTGVSTALELPGSGVWAGEQITMAAMIILAIATAHESSRGDLVKLANGRIISIVCVAGSVWATVRFVAFAVVGPTDPVFVEYFNQTTTALVRLSGFVAVSLTTAMLTATRSGAVRGSAAPTFSMGVLDWDAFVPGARDRISRVRAHGENSAVLVVEINNLEEINITYGAPSGDEAIRTLAAFLRDQLYPTTIIGHRGAGRFVLVGIAAAPQDTERRAVELLDALVRVRVSGRTGFRLGVSIGTSDSFAEEHAFDELFAAASAACQRARTGVGGRVQTSAVDGSERRSGELAGAGHNQPNSAED